MQEQEYMKGFNNAYLLATYRPELLQEIIPDNNSIGDYYTGFFAGKEQWEFDKEQEKLQELTSLRDDERINDRELER